MFFIIYLFYKNVLKLNYCWKHFSKMFSFYSQTNVENILKTINGFFWLANIPRNKFPATHWLRRAYVCNVHTYVRMYVHMFVCTYTTTYATTYFWIYFSILVPSWGEDGPIWLQEPPERPPRIDFTGTGVATGWILRPNLIDLEKGFRTSSW